MKPGVLALLSACAALAAAGAQANPPISPEVPESAPRLVVHVPAIGWSPDRVEFDVEQRGALAGRALSVTVFVDGNMIRGYPTTGKSTAIVLEELELEPGRHRVKVRSGTHQAEAEFRYVPPARAALAAAAVAAVAAAIAIVGIRRRKKRS